jgi:hypothetical protein
MVYVSFASYLTSLGSLSLSLDSLSSIGSISSLLPITKPIPGDSPLQQCDISQSQLLDLHSVDLFPNPPERGANLTITAKGWLDEDVIDGAYVDVVVTFGYIKLISQTYDLCEELPNVNMTCPLQKGDYEITKEVAIPNEVPPGKYSVTARAYNYDDELITCLTGTVEFPALL